MGSTSNNVQKLFVLKTILVNIKKNVLVFTMGNDIVKQNAVSPILCPFNNSNNITVLIVSSNETL